MGGRLSRSALAFAVVLSVGVCRAAEPDSTGATFAEAADLATLRAYALTHNPEIAAMLQRWRAARIRRSQDVIHSITAQRLADVDGPVIPQQGDGRAQSLRRSCG